MFRVEYRKFQDTHQEVLVAAEQANPSPELVAPLAFITLEWLLTFKDKLQLVVGIVLKAKNAHQRQVEVKQPFMLLALMCLYTIDRFVVKSEWIVLQKVLHLCKINQVIEKGVPYGELCLLQNVILIAQVEFANHAKGFNKGKNSTHQIQNFDSWHLNVNAP